VEREQGAPGTLWEYFDPHTEIEIRTGGNLHHRDPGSDWYSVASLLADTFVVPIRSEPIETF
jgi:hypothetical protein